MKLTALVTLSLVTAVMLVDFDPTWAFRLQNSQNPERRQQSDKHDALIMTNNGGRVKGGLSPNSIHGIGGSEIWPPPIPIWSFLPANKKSSSPSATSLSTSSSSSSSLSSPSSSSTSSSSLSSLNKNKRQSFKDSSSAADHRLSFLESSAPNLKSKSSSPIMSHMSHHRNSVLQQQPLHHDHDSVMEVDVDGHNNEHNGLLLEEDEEEEPWTSNLKRSSPSGEVIIRKPEDSKRAKRDYDVPQIECQPAADGMEMFACPNPDKLGRYRCIDDHVLCDGFVDCPNGEDEDRQACMFYKTTKAHLDVLADALLRWARGKKR